MAKKQTYEPPVARDLSAFSASGQMPLGNCTDGGKPYETCQSGTSPSGGTCTPQGNVFPGDPACQGGSFALVQCASGSAAP
jgi:hypothetical protein